MARPSDVVVKIATGRAQRHLHYSVYDIFRGMDPHVIHAVRKLDDIGIYVVGQLVRLSEMDILKYPFMTPKIVQRMRANLLQYDLDFGMTLSRTDDQFFAPLYPWPSEPASPIGQLIQFPRAAPKSNPESPAQ